MNADTDFNGTIVDAAKEMLRGLSSGTLRRIDTHALARDLTAVSWMSGTEALICARMIAASHAIKAWCEGARQP